MCKMCHSSCKKCVEGNKCTECVDGLTFMYDGSCKTCNINDGFYTDLTTKICKNCIINCKVCSNSNTC